MINHKRDFTVESVVGSEKAEFQFPDVESAKNAWRLCVLQHMFYKQYEANGNTEENTAPAVQKPPSIEDKMRQMESYEDITNAYKSLAVQQRAQSTSCLDLNTPTDIDKLRSLLPSYRPAPDYETAVQQKYRNSSGPINTRENMRNAHAIMYSSQPEIHQNDTGFAAHLRYPDVTHNNIEQKNMMASIYTPAVTHANVVDLTENLGMLHLYKPPPPYPSNRISSNSTPDLAGISSHLKPHSHVMNNLVSGSSPDLVNQHYYYAAAQPVHRSQSYLPPQHGTYENLSSIFNARPQAVIVENPNITKHIKKVYDEHGNIIYCMPANMKQILQENQLPSTGFVVTRNQNAVVAHDAQLDNSSEPIYENIPFPWQNDTSQGRARTQSIHSAPEAINQNLRTQLNQNLQESLYANIQQQNAETSLNRSVQNLSSSSTNETNSSPKTMSRTNTFIVNKNSTTNSTSVSTESAETFTDVSTSTNSSGNKVKKRRWGILIGRGNKSSEKVKSATLGREKEKNKDKNQGSNNKHRWSTGLPRLHPLPPSISKETMVSRGGFSFF